jgi:hypothetical protein
MQLSEELVHEVRAGFVLQKTTLGEFCRKNNLDGKNMHRYLRGKFNSARAIEQRETVIKAALSSERIAELLGNNNG